MPATMVPAYSARPALTRAALLALAVLGILILGDLNRRMADAERLERDAIALQADVDSLEAEHVRLETAIAAVVDDSQVEAWARREAKMVRPGERLVIPVSALSTAEAPQPASPPPPLLPRPWDIWWALIFGP